MKTTSRWAAAALSLTAGTAVFAAPVAASAAPATSSSGSGTSAVTAFKVFAPSFIENAATHTVSLPRYTGVAHGSPVTYVVTDASTPAAARRLGVNFSPRLANAAGTAAAQRVTVTAGGLAFPATVDFSPVRDVVPGPTGFAPTTADPGAVGEAGYSPVIQLPDGTVLNAPQIENSTGRADKVVSQSPSRVVYRESDGFYDHRAVHYVSFDASIPLASALENATYAAALNAAPPDLSPATTDPVPPAREEIGIFTNGQTGTTNPQHQGLSSALLDGLDPLNILGEVPGTSPTSGYSPLWDGHLATWTPAAVQAGLDTRQTSFPDLLELARRGLITAPDGGPFRRSDFAINCPAISIA